MPFSYLLTPAVIIGLIGIALRVYLWYLSLGRADLALTLSVHNESVDSSSEEATTFYASSGGRDIWVDIEIENNDNRPVTIGSATLGIPYPQFVRWPAWVHRLKLSDITHRELSTRATNFPITIPPGEVSKLRVRGLEVVQQLKATGHQGKPNVLFQVLDDEKNSYLTKSVMVDVGEWEQDRGDALLTFV